MSSSCSKRGFHGYIVKLVSRIYLYHGLDDSSEPWMWLPVGILQPARLPQCRVLSPSSAGSCPPVCSVSGALSWSCVSSPDHTKWCVPIETIFCFYLETHLKMHVVWIGRSKMLTFFHCVFTWNESYFWTKITTLAKFRSNPHRQGFFSLNLLHLFQILTTRLSWGKFNR